MDDPRLANAETSVADMRLLAVESLRSLQSGLRRCETLEKTYLNIIKSDQKKRKADRAKMWREFNYLCKVISNKVETFYPSGKGKSKRGKGKGRKGKVAKG